MKKRKSQCHWHTGWLLSCFFPHWWQLGGSGLQHAAAISKQKNQPMAINTQVDCYLSFVPHQNCGSGLQHAVATSKQKKSTTKVDCYLVFPPPWWWLRGSGLQHAAAISKWKNQSTATPVCCTVASMPLTHRLIVIFFSCCRWQLNVILFPPSLMAVVWFQIANTVKNWHCP